MTNLNPHARSAGIKPPGAMLVLLAALAVSFAAMVAFASPARAGTLTVTNTNDSGVGSLRDAIKNAAPSGDTIVFAPGVRGTITLTGGDLSIDKNLTISGPGADKLAISGNNYDTVFGISRGKTVRMSGLTVTKGSSYYGGGIENYGNLTLIKSVVRDNSADYGGGIYNANVLTLTESVVSGNFADDEGGGINNYFGSLIVERSTISGNRAEFGGGIDSDTELPSEGPLRATIANSTISGNSISSATGMGGGIRNNEGLTEIKNSTITDNTSPEGQGGGVYSDDGYDTTTEVFSSIIALNEGNFGPADTFISKGYNLIGSGQVANTFNKPGDRVGVSNPGLGPLAANGGFTKTHALQSSSPAIDTGSPNCPPPTIDQRGAKRPQGGRCDIGSFEFGSPPPPPETNITSGPSGFVNSNSARFSFSSNDANSTFECKLDSGTFSDCASPKSYTGLTSGSHTFSVRAKDNAGNADATPATRTWTVDTVAPGGKVKINGGAAYTKSASVKLSLSATDPAPASGLASMRFMNDGGGSWSAWQPYATTKSWTLRNANGTRTVYVRYKDKAGNVSTSALGRIILDTIKPTISGMSPKPGSTITDTTPTIKATVKDNLTNLQKSSVKLYVNGTLISASKYSYSAKTDVLVYNSPKLSKGKKTVKVVVRDAAGNVGARSWYFTTK